MLVANRFHFENNCAILSRDGYPDAMRATIMDMLRRNPKLRVFVVHDASAAGCGMASDMRDASWFPDPSVQIVDLGLRPAHVKGSTMFVVDGRPPRFTRELEAALTPDERAWLEAGHVVELASLRPAKLMRSIYQGFARSNQIGSDGTATGDSGTGFIIWGYDGGADVYAADSFG